MSDPKRLNDIQKEYLQFLDPSGTHENPLPVSVFNELKRTLFPNPFVVFAKVFALHVVVGFFSLGICHQFGLNPFGTERSLMDWFMKVGGHNFCMVSCGILFIGLTYTLANFFLSLEELEAVRQHEWLQTGIIGLMSITAFYFFGAELALTFVALWIIGAFLGGLLAIEGSYRLRKSYAI